MKADAYHPLTFKKERSSPMANLLAIRQKQKTELDASLYRQYCVLHGKEPDEFQSPTDGRSEAV